MHMKRLFFILALALCFVVTAACGAEDVIDSAVGESVTAPEAGEDAQTPADEPAEAAADTAGEPEGETADSDDSDTDLVLSPDSSSEGSATDAEEADTWKSEETYDFSSWTVAECVEDGWDYEGVLPHITVPCTGADQINADIAGRFTELAEDPLVNVYYECGKGADRILSVVMVQQINDSLSYTAYNLDLVTGQRITGREMLALLGVDENELSNLELAMMGEEFTVMFGTMQGEDEAFYNEQYAATTSPDNAELDRVWIGAQGQLFFAGRIYSMAGAAYYEYALDTGMVF